MDEYVKVEPRSVNLATGLGAPEQERVLSCDEKHNTNAPLEHDKAWPVLLFVIRELISSNQYVKHVPVGVTPRSDLGRTRLTLLHTDFEVMSTRGHFERRRSTTHS